MIVVAAPSQARLVDDLVGKAYSPLRGVYVPSAEAISGPAEPTCLITVDEGKVVATLSYYLDPPYVRLYRIAVDPARQRLGLASQLIEHVDRAVAGPRGYALALYVIEETGNVDVFRRLGFRVKQRCAAAFAQSPTGQPVHEIEMTRSSSE